jgi:hypothetical protein
MKKIALVVLLAALAISAVAAGDQAYWGMFAETSLQKMAGMPEMPDMPEIDLSQLPPGMSAPNIPMAMGGPVRTLTVRLWSPGIAPEGATASIAPPAGLKQGSKLDLELYRRNQEDGR